MNQILVTTGDLMDAFGVSRQTITNYVDQGMPKVDQGQFDLVECWRWRYSRLEGDIRRRKEQMTLTEEETRLKKVQADLKEMELAREQGRLIAVDEIIQANGRVITAFRNRMQSLPTKAAPRVIAAKSAAEAKQIIESLVWESLNELASLAPDNGYAADRNISAESVSDRKTAAAVDGQPVGRRKGAAVTRKQRRKRSMAHRSG